MTSSALVAQRGKPKYANIAAQIEAHVVRVPFSGCWIWMGALNKGYGNLTHAGRHMTAHRASFAAANPDAASPRLVCHTCDVRECVNPDHLYSGDFVSNRHDMLARERWVHPYSKRTHCAAGHEYATVGYAISKADGSRVCRQCQREAKQRQRSSK